MQKYPRPDNSQEKFYTYAPLNKVRLLAILFFLIPFLIFLALKMLANDNLFFQWETLHAIIILSVCLLAFFVALAGYKAYASTADLRLMFIVFGFITFGAIFGLHALSPLLLPAASYGIFSHEFFDITEHYSLFFISLQIFIGASLPLLGASSIIYRNHSYIFFFTQILTALFLLLAFLWPNFAMIMEKIIVGITLLTGILFIGAIMKLVNQYRLSPNKFALYFILGLAILVNTSIIPFFYEEWNLSWWYFHIVLLLGFGVIAYGMVNRWLQEIGKKEF